MSCKFHGKPRDADQWPSWQIFQSTPYTHERYLLSEFSEVYTFFCHSVYMHTLNGPMNLTGNIVMIRKKKHLQWTLFITTFVITAKFVIMSIWSAQKSTHCVCFSIDIPMLFRKTYVLGICYNRLSEAILTNTQNVWFITKTVQKYPIFILSAGLYQVSL